MEKYILSVPKTAAEKLGLSYDKKRRKWYCTQEHPKFKELHKFLVEVVDEPEDPVPDPSPALEPAPGETKAPVPVEKVSSGTVSNELKNLLLYLEEKNIVPTVPQSIWHNMTDRQLAYAVQFGGMVNGRNCAFKDVYSAQLYGLWMKRETVFCGPVLTDSHRLPADAVIIDVGTTGTEENDDIAEISILDCNGREKYHSFFKPAAAMTEGASKVNLLTDTGLSLEPLLMEKWHEISDILSDASQIYSYGAEFDVRMLGQFLEKSGNKLRADEFRIISTKIKDIRVLATERFGSNVSLRNAVKFLNIPEQELFSTSWNAYQALLVLRSLLDEPIAPAGSPSAPKGQTVMCTGLEEMQRMLDGIFETGGRYLGHAQVGDKILLIYEQ